MSRSENNDPSITRAFQRGLSVFEALATWRDTAGVGVTQVAAEVGLDKATTARLLNTLCVAGYAYQDSQSKLYKPTAKILALGNAYQSNLDLPVRAMPYLHELRRRTDETIHLGVAEMDRIVYIAKLETQQPVQIASAIGQTMPMHTTALGKAILAAMTEEEREPLLRRLDLTAKTARSLDTIEALQSNLQEITERGYSVDDRENEESITCVGAAIVDAAGRVHGAISVSGPSFRVVDRVVEYGEVCRKAANEIGALL